MGLANDNTPTMTPSALRSLELTHNLTAAEAEEVWNAIYSDDDGATDRLIHAAQVRGNELAAEANAEAQALESQAQQLMTRAKQIRARGDRERVDAINAGQSATAEARLARQRREETAVAKVKAERGAFRPTVERLANDPDRFSAKKTLP